MKTKNKLIAAVMGGVMTVSSLSFGLVGCFGFGFGGTYNAAHLNELAESFALSVLGDDAYAWNVFFADPYEAYGFVSDEPSWYSYSARSASDVRQAQNVFNNYKRELQRFDLDELSGADATTYRTLEYFLDTYCNYYNSPYASKFELIGGSYITSEGGYVADFASTVENYTFRRESDFQDLLDITVSTKDAFKTYLDYVEDRDKAGFPLYDYTVTEMRDYLYDVSAQGEDYYLYDIMNSRIDNASFLSDAAKTSYKTRFKNALNNAFMAGVSTLAAGLGAYTGKVPVTDRSYLAEYGAAGKAYYEWQFKQRTGYNTVNLVSLYNDLVDSFAEYNAALENIVTQAGALGDEQASKFDALVEGDQTLLGLTEPQAMLDCIVEASTGVVESLSVSPEIDFKYMDETVAQRTTTAAYYVKSPLDETESVEHITLNGVEAENNPADLFMFIAHEGYPGHLYAHVNSKSQGQSLLTSLNSCIGFAEGWANYAAKAVIKQVGSGDVDDATRLYCDYVGYDMLSGYLYNAIVDIQVNYLGWDVEEYVSRGIDESAARRMIEALMENPAVYIPYGYGMHVIDSLHEKAKTALGDAYDEKSFNAALLAEGFAPTLARAEKITDEYIKRIRN